MALGTTIIETLLLASTDGVPVTDTGGRALPILHTGQRLHVIPYVWNTSTLAFEPEEKGGAGGGDASAANQATEIARLEAIRDRLPTVLSGDRLKVELPAGGGGLTDAELRATAVPVSLAALPALVAGAANIGDVDIASFPTAGGKVLTFVPVAQGAAGSTTLAAASAPNKHKLVGAVLTMSADGTLKFTDGVGDLSGAMDIAAKGGFVLATSPYPFLETGAINRALNLVTTVGLAKGVVAILTEP